MGGRVVPAAGDHPGTQAADQPAQGHAHRQAAQGDQYEAEACVGQREHPGDRRRQGELEGHQARGIVHQGLALEHVHQRGGQAVLGNGRNRHSVGWRQHCGQGEGHGQRDARQQPVNEVTGPDHGKQHQTHGQRHHRPTNAPQLALGNAPAVGEQQRRQEQEQEQLGVQCHMQAQCRPRKQGASGDLYQRQGQRNHAADQLRHADQRQQDEDGVGGLHPGKLPL
ncbi:hypothetical protein D3C80_965760 [compost metagenome]